MRIEMASIKIKDSMENKRQVLPSDVTSLGEETGAHLTVAVVDLIQAVVLMLRELVETQEMSLSIAELLKQVPFEYRAKPWYDYFTANTDRMNKWLRQYQNGIAIRMLPGQYGIFASNVNWLYETTEKELKTE